MPSTKDLFADHLPLSLFVSFFFLLLIQVNRPLAMRKEGIQTRKRKPKQNSGGSGLGSLSSVLGGGGAGSNSLSNNGINCNDGSMNSIGGQHSIHPSLHNTLMNSHQSAELSNKHGFHHHNSQQAAAAAAAAAAAVAAAVADSAVKLCT